MLFNPKLKIYALSVYRILFGFLLLVDAFIERDFDDVFYRNHFPDGQEVPCRFPVIYNYPFLSLSAMFLVYLMLIIGAIGICIGAYYRISTLMACFSFYYIFFLDTTRWNNHSYLVGLHTILFIFNSSHLHWSFDAWRWGDRHKVTHVSAWQYYIIRFQLFLVYFFAGIKKFDLDWLYGYSMARLGKHFIFYPFRFFLTSEQISLHLVHHSGFLYDFTVGFFLIFKKTRAVGIFFTVMFHFLNAQMFSIGIFPYMMLASTPIFLDEDWPLQFYEKLLVLYNKLQLLYKKMQSLYKKLPPLYNKLPSFYDRLPSFLDKLPPFRSKLQSFYNELISLYNKLPSFSSKLQSFCSKPKACDNDSGSRRSSKEASLTADATPKSDTSSASKDKICVESESMVYKIIISAFVIVYVSLQLFLPFSHHVFRGLNTWSNGMYGYSWDMMIISYHTTHTEIKVIDKTFRTETFLNPWKLTVGSRWRTCGRLTKQFMDCIHDLHLAGGQKVEVYMDSWLSINRRFIQRLYDPKVDIAGEPWSIWTKPTWIYPLLDNLDGWRENISRLSYNYRAVYPYKSFEFVADFPGNEIEYFVPKSVNSSVHVFFGQLEHSIVKKRKAKRKAKIQTKKGSKKGRKTKSRISVINADETFNLTSGQMNRIFVSSRSPVGFVQFMWPSKFNYSRFIQSRYYRSLFNQSGLNKSEFNQSEFNQSEFNQPDMALVNVTTETFFARNRTDRFSNQTVGDFLSEFYRKSIQQPINRRLTHLVKSVYVAFKGFQLLFGSINETALFADLGAFNEALYYRQRSNRSRLNATEKAAGDPATAEADQDEFTEVPTDFSTDLPDDVSTDLPTDFPTGFPTEPASEPSVAPPTNRPTTDPPAEPTAQPATEPAAKPTMTPSSKPATEPIKATVEPANAKDHQEL